MLTINNHNDINIQVYDCGKYSPKISTFDEMNQDVLPVLMSCINTLNTAPSVELNPKTEIFNGFSNNFQSKEKALGCIRKVGLTHIVIDFNDAAKLFNIQTQNDCTLLVPHLKEKNTKILQDFIANHPTFYE